MKTYQNKFKQTKKNKKNQAYLRPSWKILPSLASLPLVTFRPLPLCPSSALHKHINHLFSLFFIYTFSFFSIPFLFCFLLNIYIYINILLLLPFFLAPVGDFFFSLSPVAAAAGVSAPCCGEGLVSSYTNWV